MLTIHAVATAEPIRWHPGMTLPDGVFWLDLCRPDDAELRGVEALTGLTLPTREEISRIGLSRRNRGDGQTLHLQMPLPREGELAVASPLGIALNERYLVTLHYAPSAFIDAAALALQEDGEPSSATVAFARLLEATIDTFADSLQEIAADVAQLSDQIFVSQRLRTPELHGLMLDVGRLEGRLARLRPSQLGFARMVGFIEHCPPAWMADAACRRLRVIGNDLKSIDEFDEQLTEKLQFLLDAILGFINTTQNMVMKLLTVASVATIPPILFAGIWGMNFSHMPELAPVWAYPAALATIGLSALLPLLWFWRRGWLARD